MANVHGDNRQEPISFCVSKFDLFHFVVVAGWFDLHLRKISFTKTISIYSTLHAVTYRARARTEDETKLKLIEQQQQNPTMAISFGRNAFIDPFAMNTFLQLTSFFALCIFSLHSADSQVVHVSPFFLSVYNRGSWSTCSESLIYEQRASHLVCAYNVEANKRVITAVCMGIGYGYGMDSLSSFFSFQIKFIFEKCTKQAKEKWKTPRWVALHFHWP